MNKQLITELRGVISAALKTAGQEHGVAFELGNAKYTDVSVNFSLMAIEVGDDPSADAGKVLFEKDCRMFGLEPEHYGKSFNSNGKQFTICGLKPNNRKYPVIASNAGRSYKFEASRVKRGLAA